MMIPINKIDIDFYCRQKLDEEWMLQLALLMENGTKFPQILCAKKGNRYRLVDGRTRLAGASYLGLKEIDAKIVSGTEQQLRWMAFEANIKGSMPPTAKDNVYFVTQMIESGVSERSINQQLSTNFPKEVVYAWIRSAKSALRNRKVRQAVALIRDHNYSIKKAAETVGLKVESVKAALKGPKSERLLVTIINKINRTYGPLARSNAQTLRNVIEDYNKGRLDAHEVRAAYDLLCDKITNLQKRLLDYHGRINKALMGPDESSFSVEKKDGHISYKPTRH